jgi:hypothetical protein
VNKTMKLNPTLLKTAADTIEKQASEITRLKSQVASAKVAADKAVKVASADLTGIAKSAGDAFLAKRFLTNEAKRDAWIAKVASDHQFAIEMLVKVANSQPEPQLKKLGSASDEPVIPSPTAAVDAKWASAHARMTAGR